MSQPPRPTRPGGVRSDDWTTAITRIEPNRISVRGYAVDELMGRVGFGESIHLLLTGELPSPSIARLVEAILVSFVDHGATPPSTLASRTAASTGASLRGSVAAGVLTFGRHHGGDLLACRALLDEGLALVRDGHSFENAASTLVDRSVAAEDLPLPGFGHRVHTKDPRTARLMQLALELETDDRYVRLIREIERALARHPALTPRPMPLNVDGAAAAVCGDIGFGPEVADALLLISRIPGLAAHALEEQRREKPMRTIDPRGHRYDGPVDRRVPERRK